eukprot:TRINITY_DN13853_c0_g1_i1.p1 TRINITY_DN13853_c0_g1~~TRINITY_DN13853_c0_g1_i1.p1  ORF type:complete len:507 (-),score=117.43 TRINITY_DN13853_c0_g1_i1:14-1534(-)
MSIFGDLEDQLTCWICFEIFNIPISLDCNHSFCKDCIERVLKQNPLCPFCRKPFGEPLPLPNQEIQNLIDKCKNENNNNNNDNNNENNTNDNNNDCFIFYLPEEILLRIFQKLDAISLTKTSGVCNDFNRISNDPFLWRDIAKVRFPFCNVDRETTWKKVFLNLLKLKRGWSSGKPSDFKMTPMRGHKGFISCMKMYRNNVVSGSSDNTVKIWNVRNKNSLFSLEGHFGKITSVDFNEIKIASSSVDSTSKIWNTNTGQLLNTLHHNASVSKVSFDNEKAYTSSSDGTVRLWDLRNNFQMLHLLQTNTGAIKDFQVNQNYLVSTSSGGSKVWDLRNPNNILFNLPSFSCFQIFSSTKLVAGFANGGISLYDTSMGQLVRTFSSHTSQVTGIQTDGETIVTSSNDTTMREQILDTGILLHTYRDPQTPSPINSMQFDDKKIVSGATDNTIKVWNRENGTRIYSLLGGSLRQNDNSNPEVQGCSLMTFNEGRVVGAFADTIKCWSFED